MSEIHKISIRALLFGNGTTASAYRAKQAKLRKLEQWPTVKDSKRNRSKAGATISRTSLTRVFAKKPKGEL